MKAFTINPTTGKLIYTGLDFNPMIKVHMRCPTCLENLVKLGKNKSYQTLLEHVSNPNSTYEPPRPAFICPNGCTQTHGGYYGLDGTRYGYSLMIPLDESEAINSTMWQAKNYWLWNSEGRNVYDLLTMASDFLFNNEYLPTPNFINKL